jgi:hypothetical protein
MTNCQDPDSAAFDNYIRTQLTRAADSYAAQTDGDARLRAIMETGQESRDDATAADSPG